MINIKDKLYKIYIKSNKIIINENTKIVIMSDIHRGNGNNYDNFKKNKNIYNYALDYYYSKNYIYIELGDGDEMWEVKEYNSIIKNNMDTFKKIKQFYDNKRFIMIYGNHDMVKKYNKILKKYFYQISNENKKEILLKDIEVLESIVLEYKNKSIFLIHGHQLEVLNSSLWKITRFLVRYIWKNIETIGLEDFTGKINNNTSQKSIDKKFNKWSIENNTILITGHTHRTIFPKIGKGLYFNTGSCIYKDGITCIEIENGMISLIKWEYEIKKNNLYKIKRVILHCKEPLNLFFS